MRSVLAIALAATPGFAQAAPAAKAPPPTFAVEVAIGHIERCPARSPEARAAHFGARLAAAMAALRRDLHPLAAAPFEPIRVAFVDAGADARERAARDAEVVLQGRGVIGFASRAVVVAPTAKARDDELRRAAVHMATLALVDQVLPRRVQDELGYGWLAVGLAHRREVAEGGVVDAFVVGSVLQEPRRVWGGDPARAAAELLRRDQLPALRALLATEAGDLDLGQHVLAHALVDWLLERSAPTTHGDDDDDATAPARLVAAAREGTPCATALAQVAGGDLDAIERQLREFVRARVDVGPPRPRPTPQHAQHPHAAVFVYTSEPVRPRHRRVVERAIRQRYEAHTSGWQIDDGKPRLAIGPVNRRAGFWHADDLVKSIRRTWPMVAVLEYESTGDPTAHLDCLRRVRGRDGGDGWMLDPTVGFVPHHNAQLVTDHDERFHYLAVPDTPTGGHVGGSEFVHRGRVRWADGRRAAVGVWTMLEAPRTRRLERWHAVQRPLVDWFVDDANDALGVKRLRAVEDLDRQLSPWGSGTVFEFPVIPDGLRAGRGRR